MELSSYAAARQPVSRLISFLLNKYYNKSRVPWQENVGRLQYLLTRVCTVVEEADARYITNSGMQMQLQMLSQAMYRGHRALDSFRYQEALQETGTYTKRAKRSRTIASAGGDKVLHNIELHSALESLEATAANMAEFVVLLTGCEQMPRRPYDTYLYIDNFMFGRHAEKQKLLSFLLQHDDAPGAPAVLPIIGGRVVGKKSLVAHVCDDRRVRSHFSSILHLTGDNFLGILDHTRILSGITLVVVAFVSDVDDEDWKRFYSFVAKMHGGSKVIILSSMERLTRFGSVRPIFVNTLSYEEFLYLFKTLAFGSSDIAEHPQLVQVADEFAKEMQSRGSLVIANALADVLRRNLNIQFWCSILDRTKKMIQKNVASYGEIPNLLFKKGRPVDFTDFVSHSDSPNSLVAYTLSSGCKNNVPEEGIPKVTLGELLVDPTH